jgi:hypothetical protein
MTLPIRLCALVVLVLVAHPTAGDDWPGPQVQTVFSEDGSRFVRVTPGKSLGDTVGFAGAERGAPANARFYEIQADRSYELKAEVALLNPVAPVDLLLSESGYLITFDNWHNAGYGKVVAIYDSAGEPIASWELEQLYGPGKVERIRASASSRWWRCSPFGFADREKQTSVYVREVLGGVFVFELATGRFKYTEGTADCGREPS